MHDNHTSLHPAKQEPQSYLCKFQQTAAKYPGLLTPVQDKNRAIPPTHLIQPSIDLQPRQYSHFSKGEILTFGSPLCKLFPNTRLVSLGLEVILDLPAGTQPLGWFQHLSLGLCQNELAAPVGYYGMPWRRGAWKGAAGPLEGDRKWRCQSKVVAEHWYPAPSDV